MRNRFFYAVLPFCYRCSSSEQKTNFPDGVLKKEVKTHLQKERDLEQVSGIATEMWTVSRTLDNWFVTIL